MTKLRALLIKNGLTIRQSEVAELVSQGFGSHEISLMLFVSERCVRLHSSNIYKKLGLRDRSKLILYCHNLLREYLLKEETENEPREITRTETICEQKP